MRIGHGYDVHRLVEGRRLILGGCEIFHTHGLLGHSDADVLTHAIMDALLGAAAIGDIGQHFPDCNASFKDANSLNLLKVVCEKIAALDYKISNIDATIIAQKPKLAPYILRMRNNIADVCKLEFSQVNVKATSEEGLGFTGNLEGISAHAVCLLKKNTKPESAL